MTQDILPALLDADAAAERPLPVDHLSPSSIESFLGCPERWRRERVMKEPGFATSEKIFGAAFHRAAEQNYLQKIESHEDLPLRDMEDISYDSFDVVVEETKDREEIRWHTDKPPEIQKGVATAMCGTASAPGYHTVLAPTVQPVASERWIEVASPANVPIIGRIDLEADDGRLIDLKTGKKAKTQLDLDKSIQAAAYIWARIQEGNPSTGFTWHTAIRTIKPQQQELLTTRTDRELAAFEKRVVMTANSIADCMERYGPEGPWPEASPLAWFCHPIQCSFWSTCVWRGGSK
jgi:hypothetical protein